MREVAITIGVALGTVLFAFILLVGIAGGAWADHCSDGELFPSKPLCEPGHVTVDNWPAEYPASTLFTNCDEHAALVDNEDGDGCAFQVRSEPGRESLALFAGVLVVGALGAIVVTTGWR